MVSSKWNGNNFEEFLGMQLDFTFFKCYRNCNDRTYNTDFHVWITSEQNSYGIVTKNWFDGEDTSDYDADTIQTGDGDLIKITKVTEYQNLNLLCSQDSFYQCLGKRFQEQNFSTIIERHSNVPECDFEKICSPYSLPIGIPVCKTEADRILESGRTQPQGH